MTENVIVEAIKAIAPQGAWAVLFAILFFYTLRTQERREDKQEKREEDLKIFLKETTNEHDKLSLNQSVVIDNLKEITLTNREIVTCIKEMKAEIKGELQLINHKVNGKRRVSRL